MSCFEILEHPGAKTPDFGNPLAANGAQNGAQDHPNGTQKGVPRTWRWYFRGAPEPTCVQNRLQSSPGHHFGGFWDPLGTKIVDFRMIVQQILMRF